MNAIDRHVRTARLRLWSNDGLVLAGSCTLAAAAVFGALVILSRIFDWPVPLGWSALGSLGAAWLVAGVWSTVRRVDITSAAVKLDEAAGLRERLSSSLYCGGSDDPFAGAVRQDANRVAAGIQVSRFLPLKIPRSTAYCVLAWLAAASLTLLPEGWLRKSEAQVKVAQTEEVQRAKIIVQKRLEAVQQLAKSTPALRDLEQELEALNQPLSGKLEKPDDVRREAVKKIEKLSDALRDERQSDRMTQSQEMKKLLRGLKDPEDTKSAAGELQKSLSQGDFKSAQESLKNLQKQLATLKEPEDAERAQELQKQLENLAKALESAAQDKQLAQKLEQAGLDKESVERALKNLTKKDLEQIKQQLEKSGLTQAQIEKLAEQLQKRQNASQAAQKMAQSLQKSAQAMAPGDNAEAQAGLESTGEQLSDLEQLEQQLSEMDSTLASLDQMKNELDKPCGSCQSEGCGQCQGPGAGKQGNSGMGKQMNQGRGGLAAEEQTATGFKKERTPVHTGKGRIVGKFLVDGEQVEGTATAQLKAVTRASERDATDAINRDRIPRHYQNAIKLYFSNLKLGLGLDEKSPDDSTDDEAASPPVESEAKSENADSSQ